MGMNTVILILNDRLHNIRDDPDFGRKVAAGLRRAQRIYSYLYKLPIFEGETMNRTDVNRILSMLLKPHMIGTTTAVVAEHQKKAMADGNAEFVTDLGNVLSAIEKYKKSEEAK